MTAWSGLVQERIPADRLSRVLSWSTLGQLVPVPVGYLAAGPLAGMFGVRRVLTAGAVVIGVAVVVPLLMRQVRALTLAPPPASPAEELATAPR